jgi:hypothetical protein
MEPPVSGGYTGTPQPKQFFTFIFTSHTPIGFAVRPVIEPFIAGFDNLGLLNALVLDFVAEDRAEIDGVLGRTSDPIKNTLVFDDASFDYHAALLDVSNNTKFF